MSLREHFSGFTQNLRPAYACSVNMKVRGFHILIVSFVCFNPFAAFRFLVFVLHVYYGY